MSTEFGPSNIDIENTDFIFSSLRPILKDYNPNHIERNQELSRIGAQEDLILSNTRLAMKAARYELNKYTDLGINVLYSDILQSALEGLIIGVKKYKPELGNALSTYVRPWIRTKMERQTIRQLNQPDLSLEDNEEGNENICDKNAPGLPRTTESEALHNVLIDRILELLDSGYLSSKESEVIKHIYFNGTDKVATQAEVSVKMGFSDKRVGQYYRSAMAKIKQTLIPEDWED